MSHPTHRPRRAAWMLLAPVVMLAACGGQTDDAAPPAAALAPSPQNAPAVAAYVQTLRAGGLKVARELGEPRALRLDDAATGDRLELSGGRNARGAMTSIDEVRLTRADGSTASSTFVNATDRVIRSGEVEIRVTRRPGGGWRLEFVDLPSGETWSGDYDAGGTPASPPRRPATASTRSSPAQVAEENRIPVQVTTRGCGVVMDLRSPVDVVVQNAAGGFVYRSRAERSAPGSLVAYVPNPSAEGAVSLDFVKSFLEGTNQIVDAACAVGQAQPLALPGACLQVAASIGQFGVTAPAAVKFLAGCEVAVLLTNAACKVKGFTSLPMPEFVDPAAADLLPSLEDMLLDGLPDSFNHATVRAVIDALPQDKVGPAVTLGAGATGAGVELNDLAICDRRYTTTYTVRAVTDDPPVRDDCVNGFCQSELYCSTGDAPGATETSAERWILSPEGTALVVADEGTASGSFATSSGIVQVAESVPLEEVTPPGSTIRYFTRGSFRLEGTLGADGTIRGTAVDTNITSWARDGRTVQCTSVAEFVARPI